MTQPVPLQTLIDEWSDTAGSLRSGPGARSTGNPTMDPEISRGVVLLAVLIIVAMLSLGAYAFAQLMLVEAEATEMYGRGVVVRNLADSGLEAALDLLANVDLLAEEGIRLYDYPGGFQAVTLVPDDDLRWQGRFSVLAIDAAEGPVRFGLSDESTRISLRALLAMPGSETQQQDLLLGLPGMTVEIADAILDFIDDDDTPRPSGVESEYYLAQNPPYVTKNRPPETLEELLLVRDIDPWLLFGEDANRNGLLDPNENDGDASYPPDNSDGALDRGWMAYLTLHSRERNTSVDGLPRVFLNDSDLTQLYDALEVDFGEEGARFITAYRLYGPREPTAPDEEAELAGEETQEDSDSGEQTDSGEGGASSRQQTSSSSGGDTNRGGLDLSQSPKQEIESVFDLIGIQVEVPSGEQQEAEVLDSPFADDPAMMAEYLPLLLDLLTLREEKVIEGRININQAPREVLRGLPGMDDSIVEGILSNRDPGGLSGEAIYETTAWLVTEGLIDLDQMRVLEPWITAGGSVYRMQVMGYFDRGGPVARIEAVVDATELPPRLVDRRDLSGTGRGFDPEVLASQAAAF